MFMGKISIFLNVPATPLELFLPISTERPNIDVFVFDSADSVLSSLLRFDSSPRLEKSSGSRGITQLYVIQSYRGHNKICDPDLIYICQVVCLYVCLYV